MARVVHFEIHADDPERAVAFYTAVFGWSLTKWEGPMDYWLITTGPDGAPGINGGLVRRRSAPPVPGQAVNAYVCTIDVDALDEMMKLVCAKGGAIVVEKMAVPGVGWLAYATDTEGNLFGMMQSDPGAK